MKADFVHLHTHSHFSLLNAVPKVPALVEAAVKDNMPALALTDAGNLYGAVEFYQTCTKHDIKPIIGLDAYVAVRSRHDKESGIDNRRHRLVLLAKNNEGYKNLIKLVTDSYLEGFYYKPRIDKELIEKYKDNLIAILPSFSAETSAHLKNADTKRATEALSWYKGVFGDNCYLEITHHPEIEGHMVLMDMVKDLAKETKTPLVAAHDVYYLHPEDHRARQTMMKIQSGADSTYGEGDEDFSFIRQEQAKEYFKDTPEALENTVKIAEECTVEIEIGTWYFPDFKIESGKEPDDELRALAYEGLKRRGLSDKDKDVTDRLEYELDIIKTKGYAKYFLAVGDLLNQAHKRNILTTIRGSVAGSLTTYVLGITNVDPLAYKIPFERFLNPERPSAPDIDMDYADNRRDEIIEYAREKYGHDKVAQIGTFGTMMARAAVRDVARALGYSYSVGDRIAKLIPMGSQGFPMTIDTALEIEPELKKLYKKDAETKEVIDLAKRIEGCARHISVHAAGVVISPEPLTNFVPLQQDPKGGKLITQYEMHSVGEDGVGLLKFDFLGITNLSILADAIKRVKKIHNIDIDIENVPLDDQKAFELLSQGKTHGLFQLGGSGMTRFLKELKPSTIHDINAMVALYRPGPMESIPSYIERKHNPHLVSYLDPRLEEILDQSYGVITYQDDVLMTAINLAGYSWLEADKLRKAMGKKIPEVMEAEKEKLLKGLEANGMTPAKALQLWKLIEPFAAYGFNKAHAASYGKVAYQTAYMKANYPVEYMAALLSAESGNVDKVSETIAECEHMNIPVLPPDINESLSDFTVVLASKDGTVSVDSIRFGLSSIKNFGEGIAEYIIDERKAHGPFASLVDFLERVKDKNLNRKTLESLIKCGALDSLGEEGRGTMLHNIDTLLAYNKERANMGGVQDSLFGGLSEEVAASIYLEDAAPLPPNQKLAWEKELLGVYVSGHPLEGHKDILKKYPTTIKEILEEERAGIPVIVAGIVEETKEILTKKGDKMAFVRIADMKDSLEVVIFPKLFTEKRELFEPETCIALKGRISLRDGSPSLVVEAVKSLAPQEQPAPVAA